MMKKKIKLWLNGGVLFLTLTVVIIYLNYGGPDSMLDLGWVDTNIRNQGFLGIILFLAICAFTTGIGVPRQILSFLAGYSFGAELGTVWGVLGSALGCALGFFFARFFAREAIQSRFSTRLEKIDTFISSSPFLMTFTIRCMPMTLNVLTNLMGGVTNIRPLTFISASALGYVPQTLIFSILGSGIRVEPVWRTILSLALFMMSSALGVALYKRHRKKLALDNEVMEEEFD